MDLRLCLTEFDVGERGTPSNIGERDRFIADLARRYLDFMFAYRPTDYLMAWGMLDHYSWLQNFGGKRPDGMLKRPTLYDDDYQPKLLRQAIADSFRNAPMRT
jgi:endo-1,4-beta-xylanase